MWADISPVWKVCFEEAWEAYCEGSVPVGAAIADLEGRVRARARNRIYGSHGPPRQVCGYLAHAELNVLLALGHPGPERETLVLYTTTEPCPLCFGAFYMSGIRRLRYGARDAWAGSANLQGTTRYLSAKPVQVEGPDPELEPMATALHTAHWLEVSPVGHRFLPEAWAEDCPHGVEAGRTLYETRYFAEARRRRDSAALVYDQVWRVVAGCEPGTARLQPSP